MAGRFRCVRAFCIPRRGHFVLAGAVAAGEVRAGMDILVPFGSGSPVPYPIRSIEHLNTSTPSSSLGLVIGPLDEPGLDRLAALGLDGRELHVVTRAQAASASDP